MSVLSGWSQPVDATLCLTGEMECGDGTEISSWVYGGREDGGMGSLEARRVAEGDRTSFWQAVIVDLFSGGTAWWDSSCRAASLQAGIDARGARGDFQRYYGASVGVCAGYKYVTTEIVSIEAVTEPQPGGGIFLSRPR